MTNEELIAKIKAEIERRKSLLTQHSKLTYDLILETFIKEYDDLLSFLSTLESEHLADARKTSPDDLEEASSEFATYKASNGVSVEFLYEKLSFQEGSKWQKEQDNKELSEKIAAAYQLGLADKEKQIMKSAKDGWIDEEDVIILNDGTRIDLQPDYDKKPAFEFKYAQNVCVIVLPKED